MSRFCKWPCSKSYQCWRTVEIQGLFGRVSSKQLLFKLSNDEWRRALGSTILENAPNQLCHWCVLDETVEGRALQSWNEACKELKNGGEWGSNQDQLVFFGVFSRKVQKCKMRVWENMRFSVFDVVAARAFSEWEWCIYVMFSVGKHD